MTTATITLTDAELAALDELSRRTGKSREALIHDGLVQLIEHEPTVPPKDWREGLMQAAGMWKDRDDLPDLRELREESERRLERLGLGSPPA